MSGFQIHFASKEIYTPGDSVEALVAMNPAALATNLGDLVPGGILVVNNDAFDDKGVKQAGYASNPLEDGSLSGYQMFLIDMTRLTRLAVDGCGLGQKESDRCRNFFAMGLVFWLYDRPLEPTLRYIDEKFAKKSPAVAEANRRALKAGYNYGETTEAFASQYRVHKAKLPPGTYRNITGNEAIAYGLMAAAKLQRLRAVPRQLSDHAGQRHPARAARSTRISACGRSRPRTKSPPSPRPSAPPSAGPWR